MSSDASSTKPSFFTTLPGLLTAIAALVTACVGAYAAIASHDRGAGPAASASTTPAALVATQAPRPTADPPAVGTDTRVDDGTTSDPAGTSDQSADEAELAALDDPVLVAALAETATSTVVAQLASGLTLVATGMVPESAYRGLSAWAVTATSAESNALAQCTQDTSACTAILVDWLAGCHDYGAVECDVLYEAAPDGSALARYGATCGSLYPDGLLADACRT